MSKRSLLVSKIMTPVCLILILVDSAWADPHRLEVRMAPSALVPKGAALAVRYENGLETKLSHDWQSIALLNTLKTQPDHNLLRYRVVIEQIDQVQASVLTVTVQYRLVAQE